MRSLLQTLPLSRFGGLALLEGACTPTKGGAKMTNPSLWKPQAPATRSTFLHPAQRGKRKEGSGSRRTPVLAGAAIAAFTPWPGGHATRRGTSTARSAGTPRAFAERSQGHHLVQGRESHSSCDSLSGSLYFLSPVDCVVYTKTRLRCRLAILRSWEQSALRKGMPKMPNRSLQNPSSPAPAGPEPF